MPFHWQFAIHNRKRRVAGSSFHKFPILLERQTKAAGEPGHGFVFATLSIEVPFIYAAWVECIIKGDILISVTDEETIQRHLHVKAVYPVSGRAAVQTPACLQNPPSFH